MIRKSGHRFSEKIMLKQKIERDDDSKKSHPALALQLPFPKISESMGNHDSKIVDADSVD